MRIRRTLPIVLAVVAVAAAITFAVQLRKSAPPEAARLLPGADAFLYANFSWARKLSTGKPVLPVSHDPEYERFIQETGFDYERDLDSIAFAVHYPAKWTSGGSGGAAPEPRFSEVFTGHFDGAKCGNYLRHASVSIENYRGVEIFSIPIYGRTFRIAILGIDTVAASNHEDPAVIRGMVDRSRRLASPFGGPALLRRYYKRVQLASPFWAIAHLEPSLPQLGGWSTFLTHPADFVVSASYNPLHFPLRSGVLHLRAEAWAGTTDDARTIADKLNVFLAMFHSAETSVGSAGTDPDLKTLFESLRVVQEENRAVLIATLPSGLFHKLADSSDELPSLATPSPQVPPTSGPEPERSKKSKTH